MRRAFIIAMLLLLLGCVQEDIEAAREPPPAGGGTASPGHASHADLSRMPKDISDYSGMDAIYVSIGGDDSGTGTIDAPLRTIGAALLMADEGSAVFISEGIYETETIRIDGSGIALVGSNAIIVPSGSDERAGIVIEGPVSDVTIDGLSIMNFSGAGLIYGDSGTQRRIMIKNLAISGTDEGISNAYPTHSAYLVEGLLIRNVSVLDYGFIGVQCGDEDEPCAKDVLAEGLTIRSSGSAGGDTAADAFAFVQSENILIRDSLIVNASGDGLDFKASNVSVMNVTVRDVGRNGIKFWRDGEIIGSHVSGTGADAAIVFDVEADGMDYRIVDSSIGAHLSSSPLEERYSYAMTVGYDNPDNKATLMIANSTFYDMPGAIWVSRSISLDIRNVTFRDFRDGLFLSVQDGMDYESASSLEGEAFASGITYG